MQVRPLVDEHELKTTEVSAQEFRARPATLPRPPAGQLVCLVGTTVGTTYRFGTAPITIGRAADADICLQEPDISRRHARISWRDGRFVLDSLGVNGTLVNGLRVESHPLAIGDRIQLASVMLVYAQHDDLERRAHQMQKLEALGQLAGGLAHDFKNILSVILSNTEFLVQRDAQHDDSELKECLRDIQLAARSGNTLTQRLLCFARRNVSSDASVADLAALVDATVSMVRRTFTGTVKLEVDVVSPVQVWGNRDDLTHLLVNLLLNARDAMPGGGAVSIRARTIEFPRAEALANHLPQDGHFVELSVTDTGTGMDEATSARAFEPFFTTKAPGEGTGLGLSTVYGIARNLGGNVIIESILGEGTCVRVLLPATDAARDPELQTR